MVKTLQVDLGVITLPELTTGWYRDVITGQYYYYDAPTRRWFIYSAGALYPLATRWTTAPKSVEMTPGDTLRIEVSFSYRGPAFGGRLYGAIGQRGAFDSFDEILKNSKSLSLPESGTFRSYSNYLDIAVTSAISAGQYAIYAKITDGVSLVLGQTLSDYLENAVRVVGVEAEFSDFSIADYRKV